MRVTGHGRDPKTPLVIEGDLNGLCQVLKLLLRREELDFISRRNDELIQGILPIQVLGITTSLTELEVRLYGRKLSRLSISRLQIELFPLDCAPDGGIPQRSHLANFSQFRGIVVRAKGFIATAEHMNSIGDFEVIMPKPVFLLDGIVHQSPMRLGLGSSLSKNLIGEQRSEPGIACIGKL